VGPTVSSVTDKAGRNAVVTGLTVCCGYIVCATPIYILEIMTVSVVAIDYGSWYYNFVTFLMLANSVINPFIYAAKYREFQRGVRSLLSKMNLNQQRSQVSAVT